MKTVRSTLLLLLFLPLTQPAPQTLMDSHINYEYGIDNFEEAKFSQDYEDKYLHGKNMKEKETVIIPDEKSLQLQKDEAVPSLSTKKENDEMPTCLLCVCLSGSVYCEEVDIDAVPPLPKESAYLYARFNKIKKLTAKDFADMHDTFCKANDTHYIRDRIEEIRLEGNPIALGKHPNSFICLKRLPIGSYF
ncbi:osteoglycin [Cricetulus griseus]